MRCEICGKKVIGKPVRTKIENSIMLTCNDCSKFGKVQREPLKPQRGPGSRAPAGRRRSFRSQDDRIRERRHLSGNSFPNSEHWVPWV